MFGNRGSNGAVQSSNFGSTCFGAIAQKFFMKFQMTYWKLEMEKCILKVMEWMRDIVRKLSAMFVKCMK